jgi:hypothetical protein
MKPLSVAVLLLACGAISLNAHADSMDAACVIYPAGEDRAEKTLGCRFYQAQGHVVITRDDGVEYDFVPDSKVAGNFTNQAGEPVYRQGGLGDQGLIFRMPQESVYVYWSRAMLEVADEDSPTWPFTTRDYDATTLLSCRAADDVAFETCPAGILRMDGGQASIVVLSPTGEQFTINFLGDTVNATNRGVKASLTGDLWTLQFDNGELWEVPLAAIVGG